MFKNVILRPITTAASQAGTSGVAVNTNLEHIDDDFRVQDACRDFDYALSQFHGLGDQPSYGAMRVLYSAGLELRDALMAAEEFSTRAGRVTRTALMEAREQLKVAMRLEPDTAVTRLRHLDLACARYGANPPGLNRFPALFAAVETYMLALREQLHMPGTGQSEAEKNAHVETREKLDAPARATRLNKFRSAENTYWNKGTTPAKLLKIVMDHRSTPEDRAAFQQLLESGALVPAKMADMPPQYWQGLVDHYAENLSTQQEQQQTSVPALDLIAVRSYPMCSTELNQALRDNDREKILHFAPYIKSLMSALNQFPDCVETENLQRGVRLDADAIIAAGMFEGNRWSTRSFMSCSIGGDSSYCKMPEKYNVQIRIFGGHAKLIAGASPHGTNEREVMYKLGSTFDVIKVDYLEGQGSKEYPRLDVTMRWVDMSKVRVDGRFKNGSAESSSATAMQDEDEVGVIEFADEECILSADTAAHEDNFFQSDN